MKRLWLVLVLCGVVGLCAAATEDRTHVQSWGRFVDPDNDCAFRLEKGTLTITVPAKAHDLGIERDQMNAPRVLRDVEGDFIAHVKVSGAFRVGNALLEDRAAYNGAGLLLMKDEKTYIRIERAAFTRNETFHYANFELREDGEINQFGNATDQPLEDGKDTWLRLERQGDKIHGAVSQDGIKWLYQEPKTVALPKKLQVGVAAVNTASLEFAPQFTEFKLFREVGVVPR
jgi:regulation of enolase protein 1 (concanavalin A-like superfamily)